VNDNVYNKALEFKIMERVDFLQLKTRRTEEDNEEERREGKYEERRGKKKEVNLGREDDQEV